MLTLKQLEELLRLNGVLLKQALADNNTSRAYELSVHRAVVKDCIIEELQRLVTAQTKAA